MDKVRELFEKINMIGEIRFNESMSEHTTFKIGGPADVYAVPTDVQELIFLIKIAREKGIPYFILGGGANILVADAGIRGLVISMEQFNEISAKNTVVTAGAGMPVSNVSAFAADNGLTGFEFIYAMPGSLGGAVWMNARCYDSSISDILLSVDYLDENLEPTVWKPTEGDFGYKHSPFMDHNWIILSASFQLTKTELRNARSDDQKALSWKKMRSYEEDRRQKGHFAFPCAGSLFKNNRAFGKPSGAIIDSLGLRGYTMGGAGISEQHANIFINRGDATARDMRQLVDFTARQVEEKCGFTLEPEVLFIGDWKI